MGSEMCIRDSLQGQLPQFLAQQNQQKEMELLNKQRQEESKLKQQEQGAKFLEMYNKVTAQNLVRAKSLLESGNDDALIELGMHHAQIAEKLGQPIDDAERITLLAKAKKQGSQEAAKMLEGEINTGLQAYYQAKILDDPNAKTESMKTLEQRAIASGRQEGTPAYQEFIGSGGTKETDQSTPFIKELNYRADIEKRLEGMDKNTAEARSLMKQRDDISSHIARLDAPTSMQATMAADAAQAAKSAGLEGEDFLNSLPEDMAGTVKGISEGRLTFSSLGLRGQDRRKMVNAVMQYDPEYDEAVAKSRYRATSDFTTGKNGNTVRSLSVAMDHLDTLGSTVDALKNGNVRLFNELGNQVAAATGNPAPTDFNAVKQIVGDEIVKAVIGGAGALGDREEVAKVLNAANSPQQLASVVNRYKQLMGGQLKGLRKQYEASTGRKDFDEKFLFKETREITGKKQSATEISPPANQSQIDALMEKYGNKNAKP